jgi:hypothetical protein
VAKILTQRRDYPTLEVIEAIKVFGQPELLDTDERRADLLSLSGEAITDMVVAPLPRGI